MQYTQSTSGTIRLKEAHIRFFVISHHATKPQGEYRDSKQLWPMGDYSCIFGLAALNCPGHAPEKSQKQTGQHFLPGKKAIQRTYKTA